MSKIKTKLIIIAATVVALVLRLVQIFAFTDYKTGFFKRNLSVWGTILTVAILLICAAASIFSRKTLTIEKPNFDLPISVASGFLSIALFYELFMERIAIEGVAWQAVLMKAVGFLAAVYFGAVAFSKFFGYKIPDMVHIIPTFYMLIRIVCSFINITSLSLIAENIFYVAGLCCVLLFFVSYAGVNALEEFDKKSLNMRAVLGSSICFITAVSNMAADIFAKGGYNHIPLHSQLVMLMLSLFIGVFAFGFSFKNE